MKRRNLKLQISPKRFQRAQTAVYECQSAITPRDKLRGKADEFMQELTLQVETLEDALRAEQQLKEKYETALTKLEKENKQLAEDITVLEHQLALTREELEVQKNHLVSPAGQKRSLHQRKKSEPFFNFRDRENENEQMLQNQIKSLQDLCASQEKLIQKCVKNLHKKKDTIEKYKQQVMHLREEKANLTCVLQKEKALLDASRFIFEEDEDESLLSTSESPAPFYKNSEKESLSLLDELSSTFHDFTEEQAFNFEKVNESNMRIVSPIIKPHNPDFADENMIEINPFASRAVSPANMVHTGGFEADDNLVEIHELVASTHNLLKEFLTKVSTPRKRRSYRTCLLGRLTQNTLFQLNV
mmetsp:Transcript_2158/g.5443  ORF Transcript_2158/g.5443 Transcript_2158/m.5443 type:complete len:358 (-) Transcript_2158:5096-6169(-)